MQPSNAQVQDLPPELRSIVEGELGRDEPVQWLGRPIPGLLARKAWPLVLFGVLWTTTLVGFSGWGFRQRFGSFQLFDLPFVLVGAGMLLSPFWLLWKGGRTAYVLTNQRAIIVERGLFSTKVRSFAPGGLGDIERKQRSDGAGDLVFTREYRQSSEGSGRGVPIGFLAVADVKEVEDRIRGMIAAATQAPLT